MIKLSAPSDWTSPNNLLQHARKHGPGYGLSQAEYDALATELLGKLTELQKLRNNRARPADKHTDGENVLVTTPGGKIITMYKNAMEKTAAEIRQYVKSIAKN